VPDPQKILCVGLNYRAHANEAALDEPVVPMVFAKFPNVLIGAGAPIELPEGHGEKVDYEGEIAVVIGRRAYRRSEDDAIDVVCGLDAVQRRQRARPAGPDLAVDGRQVARHLRPVRPVPRA
jgi:2-keto-4-pentenoate hydratase/2-oxohepta-3-ene-1,7-dioic acid hydratase in catechol pathway